MILPVLLLTPLVLAQTTPPSVTLTVEGENIAIRHVCAFATVSFEEKPMIKVMMAAKAPAEEADCPAVERQMLNASRREEGEVAGISAELQRGKTGEWEWTDGTLYVPGRLSPYSSSWWSGVGEGKEPSNRFTASKDSQDGVLAGRLWTARTNTMLSSPAWKLDARFSVPLQKPVPPTEITGAEAEKHPAVVAAKRYLGLMESGDRKALREARVASEREDVDRMMDGERGPEIRENMRNQGKELLAMPRVAVKARGELATVEFRAAGTGKGRAAVVLKQEGGAWWITNEMP